MRMTDVNDQNYRQILRELIEIPDENLKEVLRMIHEYRLALSTTNSEDVLPQEESTLERDTRLLDKLGGCLGEESVEEYDFDLDIGGYYEARKADY